MNRCKWCDLKNPKYVEYHDKEGAFSGSDDSYLFEMLVLECLFRLGYRGSAY